MKRERRGHITLGKSLHGLGFMPSIRHPVFPTHACVHHVRAVSFPLTANYHHAHVRIELRLYTCTFHGASLLSIIAHCSAVRYTHAPKTSRGNKEVRTLAQITSHPRGATVVFGPLSY